MKGIYVTSFDDILVNTSELLYNNIRQNWRIYSKWFSDLGNMSYEDIQSRKILNINEWLIKKKFIELTSYEYSDVQIEIIENFIKTFYMTDMFKYAQPSLFCKQQFMNRVFLDDSLVYKIYIISKCRTEEEIQSKRDFIKRYLDHPKIEFIPIKMDENISDVLKEKEIIFNAYIDNEISNIRDIAESYKDLTKKEFIIPKYGYTEGFPRELNFLIEERGGVVVKYDPFKKK